MSILKRSESIIESDNRGSYPLYDKSKIDPKYLCPKCDEIFNEPYQASCGCRYCLKCLNELEKSTGVCLVKTCQDKLNADEKSPDKAHKKETLNMIIACIICDWTGKLIEYRTHFDQHEVTCIYCKKKFDSVDQLNVHNDEVNGDCQLQQIKCLYLDVGCDYKGPLNRQNLSEHLKDYVSKHLDLTFKYFQHRLAYLERLKNDSMQIEDIETQSTKIIKTKLEAIDEPPPLSVSVKKTKVESSDATSTSSASAIQSSSVSSTKLASIELNQMSLTEELNKTSHLFEQFSKDIEELKEAERKNRAAMQQLQKTLTCAQATIISLEERVLAQEKTSYNGTLVWKIVNVHEKINDSKSGRQTSYYSPPFYSHSNGYKMCARIYLNGDGMGRGTHVSLFFVLMRGEYDILLRWPFRQKVTFVMIDQSQAESRENIVDAFRPDPNSTSFRKPVSEMNIASGIPLFCSLQKFNSTEHEYVKDDTMYIKVIVDTRELVDV